MHAENPARTLVLVAVPRLGSSALARIRSLQEEGATILAWEHRRIVQDRFPSPEIASALRQAGVPCETPGERLGETEDRDVEDAVIAWTKALGRAPLAGGVSFRDGFRYHALRLWWWAELYLYHETPLRLFVRDVEILKRLLDRQPVARLVVVGPVRCLARAAARLAGEAKVEVEILGPSFDRYRPRTTRLFLSDLLKMLGTGLKSLFRRRPAALTPAGAGEPPRVFFLTHASMWKARRDATTGNEILQEMYFDRILPAVAAEATTSVVAFGPPVPFKERRLVPWLRDLAEVDRGNRPYRSVRDYFSPGLAWVVLEGFMVSLSLWRRFLPLVDDPADKAVSPVSHHGVSLLPETLPSFRDTFLRQFPWCIRAYHEVGAVLEVEKPDVLVLYAESSGLGRAAVAAAREQEVASFAVQHGIMYAQYYSHEHRPDELEGEASGEAVPIPTKTAVFGSLARDLLVSRGSYPPSRIVITGSPKFDALVEAAEGFDAAAVRAELGLSPESRFVVLATRFSAVGPVFRELVEAVESIDSLWLVVKPHQAESPQPYEEVVAACRPERVVVLSRGGNLLELLFASDGLVTVDSFASSEALVLGRPVLVVNLPSNLEPLVERGVALGARRGESIAAALRTLLFDVSVGRELEARRQEYIREFAFGADGRSTERVRDAILATAREARG